MTIFKKSLFFILAAFATLTLSACWESDTENAAEDVGESIERTAEDVQDSAEEAAEEVEETVENPE